MELYNYNFNWFNMVKWHWTEDEYSFMEKPRPQHGFLTVLNGRLEYFLDDGRCIVMHRGDFIYLPKNATYRTKFYIKEGAVDTLLVNFDFSDDLPFPIPPFFYGNDPTLQIETTLEKLLNLKRDEFYLKKAYFYLCFHLILQSYIVQDSALPEFIQKAKIMLTESETSVEEIAERLGISNSYFRKRFKESVGISPVQYRISKRLEEAKHLLIYTAFSTDEIAFKTGFYDTPYFYKKFREEVGITPKKYRETNKLF